MLKQLDGAMYWIITKVIKVIVILPWSVYGLLGWSLGDAFLHGVARLQQTAICHRKMSLRFVDWNLIHHIPCK